MKVLVTGGGGFIGSHISELLLKNGYNVRILDLNPPQEGINVEYIRGDLLDKEKLKEALEGVEVVCHQSGLSGFRPNFSEYVLNNCVATSNIIDIIKENNFPVKQIIFASTNAVYGAGSYECEDHGIVNPKERTKEQLENKNWELDCPICGEKLTPISTKETKSADGSHIYAITKRDCEKILESGCESLGIDLTILRYSLVYGPREAPFRIASIFLKKLVNGLEINLNEDGNMIRDFINVRDVARANLFVIDNQIKGTYNVGTGIKTGLREFILNLSEIIGIPAKLSIEGTYREGDIRDSFLDISKIMGRGFSPEISLKQGILDYISWIEKEKGGLKNYFKE